MSQELLNHQPHLLKYLKNQRELIHHIAPQVSRELTGKSVHDLRLATRRVRSTLWLLKKSSAHLRFENLDLDLYRLGKALGSVRELDVAILDAFEYGIDHKKLVDHRKVSKIRLKKQVDKLHRRKIETQLADLEESVQAEYFISLNTISKRLRSQLKSQLKSRIRGQNKLHRLRVFMKRIKYVLESMGSPVKPITRLQCILGDAHDLEFLQASTRKSSRLKTKQKVLNKKAGRLIRPALRFAAKQLH